MLWRPDPYVLSAVIVLAACTRRPEPEPPRVEPALRVHKPLCAASMELAHACTGAQSALDQCSVFTASAVTSEITNNTDDDLAFVTGMMIVDGRGHELLPAVLGPELRVPARSTGRPWQIALPRLPDGYVLIRVLVLGTRAGDESEQSTYTEGMLLVRDGQIEVLDYYAWSQATDSMNVHELVPGQPDPVQVSPTPGEQLYEQLRTRARRRTTP